MTTVSVMVARLHVWWKRVTRLPRHGQIHVFLPVGLVIHEPRPHVSSALRGASKHALSAALNMRAGSFAFPN